MTRQSANPVGRTLNKQEAIRHLIHAAIRMLIAQEGPFAIHLLVQSADKILIDIAKKRRQELRIDWELYIKDEFRKDFFAKHRAVYNFFKHAGDDDLRFKTVDRMDAPAPVGGDPDRAVCATRPRPLDG
jgi:hypothetical protein